MAGWCMPQWNTREIAVASFRSGSEVYVVVVVAIQDYHSPDKPRMEFKKSSLEMIPVDLVRDVGRLFRSGTRKAVPMSRLEDESRVDVETTIEVPGVAGRAAVPVSSSPTHTQ